MIPKQDSSFRNLSNEDLLDRTKNLVKEERRTSTTILYHLLEIATRNLYKDLGYSNLQNYCVHELKYSNATANQLIGAMNLLTDLPEIQNKIEQGSLSMTTASRIQRVCRAQEKAKDQKLDRNVKANIIGAVEGKSKKEAETILKSMYPKPSPSRPPLERKESDRNKTEIKVTLDPALMAKLEKVKELTAHEKIKSSYAELIDWLAEAYLQLAESPETNKAQKTTKKKRPPSIKNKAELSQQKRLPLAKVRTKRAEPEEEIPPVKVRMRRKSLPPSTTRRVWEKANGQCCYLSPVTGRRCSERGGLEIEHVVPISQGGNDDPSNLLLFCKNHSLHSAIKKISQDQMRKFIEKLRLDEYLLDQRS